MSLQKASALAGIIGTIIAAIALYFTVINPKSKAPEKVLVEREMDPTDKKDKQYESKPLPMSTHDGTNVDNSKIIPDQDSEDCPSINSLKISSDTAKSIYKSKERDSVYIIIVQKSLCNKQYNVSIDIASKIYYSTQRDRAYSLIVHDAIENNDFEAANKAASMVYYTDTKDKLKRDIIIAGIGKQIPSQIPTEMEMFKEIYQFADSAAYMSMSESEAKEFTEWWLKNKTYAEFVLFRDVYKFADSSAYMSMSEEKAKLFALAWIDKHTRKDFEYFKEVYNFADSSAHMNLSPVDARNYAMEKLENHKKEEANKVNPADKKNAAD